MEIDYVTWRNGRPRFSPSPALRKKGHAGHDLKILDGDTLRFMTAGEALDWSANFRRQIEGERQAGRAARAKAKAKAAAAATRHLPKLPKSKSYTLGQMLEDYLVRGLAGLSPSRKKPFSAGTKKHYAVWIRIVEKEAPLAWATEARAISRKIARGIYEDILRRRSVGTALQCMSVVSAAFTWAIDDEADGIETNPAARLKMARPKPRVRTLSVAGYVTLLATAEAMGEKTIADLLVLGVWTAQRISDRRVMTPADIVESRWHCTQIKTGARVAVKLAKPARARLPAGHTGPYFARRNGTIPSYEMLRLAWLRVVARASEDMPELSGIHDQDLRDTAVTWMGRAGCSIPEIMSVTGHSFAGDQAEVLGHYFEFTHELSDQAIAKLERWYAKQITKLKGAGK